MNTKAEKKSRFKPLGVLFVLVGVGLIGAGVLGIERGLTYLLGNFTLFAGIAIFMYQTFVQE